MGTVETKGVDVLVVIDYQKDFVDGALGFETAPSIDKGIAKLVKEYAEKENGAVYFTFDTHEENYIETKEGKNLPVKHCIKGTEGWKLYGETEMAEIMYPMKCTRVYKPTFGSLELGNKLKMLDSHPVDRDAFNDGTNTDWVVNNVKTITFVGVVTNMCVISNAIIANAACPEAKIRIIENLCDGFDKELHQKAIDVMKSQYMEIVTL